MRRGGADLEWANRIPILNSIRSLKESMRQRRNSRTIPILLVWSFVSLTAAATTTSTVEPDGDGSIVLTIIEPIVSFAEGDSQRRHRLRSHRDNISATAYAAAATIMERQGADDGADYAEEELLLPPQPSSRTGHPPQSSSSSSATNDVETDEGTERQRTVVPPRLLKGQTSESAWTLDYPSYYQDSDASYREDAEYNDEDTTRSLLARKQKTAQRKGNAPGSNVKRTGNAPGSNNIQKTRDGDGDDTPSEGGGSGGHAPGINKPNPQPKPPPSPPKAINVDKIAPAGKKDSSNNSNAAARNKVNGNKVNGSTNNGGHQAHHRGANTQKQQRTKQKGKRANNPKQQIQRTKTQRQKTAWKRRERNGPKKNKARGGGGNMKYRYTTKNGGDGGDGGGDYVTPGDGGSATDGGGGGYATPPGVGSGKPGAAHRDPPFAGWSPPPGYGRGGKSAKMGKTKSFKQQQQHGHGWWNTPSGGGWGDPNGWGRGEAGSGGRGAGWPRKKGGKPRPYPGWRPAGAWETPPVEPPPRLCPCPEPSGWHGSWPAQPPAGWNGSWPPKHVSSPGGMISPYSAQEVGGGPVLSGGKAAEKRRRFKPQSETASRDDGAREYEPSAAPASSIVETEEEEGRELVQASWTGGWAPPSWGGAPYEDWTDRVVHPTPGDWNSPPPPQDWTDRVVHPDSWNDPPPPEDWTDRVVHPDSWNDPTPGWGGHAGKSDPGGWNPPGGWGGHHYYSGKPGGGWGGKSGKGWKPQWKPQWEPNMCVCETLPPSNSPNVSPTYKPSMPPTPPPFKNPTYIPTYVPSKSPNEMPVTPMPTPIPTYAPTGVTYAPSKSPDVMPTSPMPTEYPTFAPTTEEPTSQPTVGTEECNWFYWGGEEGRGSPVGPEQETPEFQDDEVIDLSAGSRHTFIVNENGLAYVSGFIESFHAYKGHLGVEIGMLEEGPNGFMQVNVVTEDGETMIPAPKFVQVHAGAGAPGDSRDMHSLLIDVAGNVYTAGDNDMGQLCHGNLESEDVFRKVQGLPLPAIAAGVGLDFTLILLADGQVYGCGSNENGELGLGSELSSVDVPTSNGLSDIVDVSAGLNYGIYLQSVGGEGAGTVFGSGSNLFSQLCESTGGDPVDVPKELDVGKVMKIMAGRESSYYLYENGSVESCGRNDEGQLADGTFVDSDKPVKVDIPKPYKIHSLWSGASSQSVFFVADEDVVFGAGQNYRFQLGIGKIGSEKFPVLVEFDDAPWRQEITKISSSGTHTVAISCPIITETPTAYPTISPTSFPTITPTETPTAYPTENPTIEPTPYPSISPTETPTNIPTETPTAYPTENPTIEPTLFPSISPTLNPTMSPTYIDTDEPTVSPTMDPTLTPTLSPTMSPTYIDTDEPTLSPTMDPTLTPTLSPTMNPTYIDTDEPTLSPTLSPSFQTYEPTQFPTLSPTFSPTFETLSPTLSPSMSPTLSPTFSPTLIEGNWYYWGAEEGRGNSLGDNEQVPQEIPDEIIDVSAGSRHTFLIEGDGTLQAAGFIESTFGYRGHLGLGPVQDCENGKGSLCELTNDPLPVKTVVGVDLKKEDAPQFERVYAGVGVPADSGEMHSLVISKDGRAYVAGNNNKGQLCLGDLKSPYEDLFHQVNLPGDAGKAVRGAVGQEFTLILTDKGKVYGCGTNEIGQIGQGDNVDYSAKPVQIEELEGINDLATGLGFAIFLNRDKNKVWGIGGNLYGQLCGFSGGSPLTRPDDVSQIVFEGINDGVVQVEANRESSYFLYEDGTARSCGRNDEGQLGNGDFINTSQKEPIVRVNLNKKILSLGSGPSSQSVFFIGEENVWASGLNDRFQLGIDEIGSRDTPVMVDFKGPVDIEFISSSGSHTVANGRYY